mgnify:CR=1 FL=1
MNYFKTLIYGNKILKVNNIKSYSLDSELILAKVLNSTREELLINLEKKVDDLKFNSFKKLLLRRKKKEPLAYILKKKEFWKNNFFVNKDVLIPRPETELIVDQVLKFTDLNSSKHILDIGTGSGCIILSIIKERPKWHGTALDISKKAIKVAISNAKMHHLQNKIRFLNIDIDKFKEKNYDLIVSNPPYINKINLKRLDDNVRLYEPKIALKAGVDGLSEIRKVISKGQKLLKRNGKLVFEIGNNQMNKIKPLLIKNGFHINKICSDLQSLPRVIVSTKL